MVPVAEQNTVDPRAVRHVLVVGALKLEVEGVLPSSSSTKSARRSRTLAKSTFRNALIFMPPANWSSRLG